MPGRLKGDDPREKIKKWLSDNGIMKKWFAAQIGMNHRQLNDLLNSNRAIPIKYWKRIIEVSGYVVTLQDLAELARFDKSEKEEK